MPESAIIGGIATNILLIVGLWIREYFKHKDWKKKNGGLGRIESDIKEIKTSTNGLDKKAQRTEKDIGIIKTEVTNIHYNCKKYERDIGQNRQEILTLHKEKADKRKR
jgi:septal ring factor EnvC (AmiA/AmiB activator)